MTGSGEPRVCPVCGAGGSARKFSARDPHYGIPGEWWIRECLECGSFFLENPPSEVELEALYPNSYYAYSIVRPSRIKTLLQRVLFYDKATREPRFERPGSMLDFGCGAGEFLLSTQALGWQGAGVEISDAARAVAREQGLDVRPALLGARGFEPGRFDYVRANHSLEHVLHPDETLRQMFQLLKPGGTLFLGVPTNSGESARIFGASWWGLTAPLHTFVPSTRGMKQLVERSGFVVTRVSTNGDYTSTAGSLQIALNRGTSRKSNEGILFTLRPLLFVGHWLARLQDLRGVGDKLELIAVKPA